MNITTSVDDQISRLKNRYAQDNSVLDLIYLMEKLRTENLMLHDILNNRVAKQQ